MHQRQASILKFALFFLAATAAGTGQSSAQTLTQVIGPASSLNLPDLTPEQTADLLQQIRSPAFGRPAPYILEAKLSAAQYRNYLLLKRASAMGWLKPLQSTRGSSAADDSSCDKVEREKLTAGIARFVMIGRCPYLQREASKWIFAKLNRVDEQDPDRVIRNLFLLQSTAGADLTPVEVYMAIEDKYPDIPSSTTPSRDHLREPEFPTSRKLSSFESWDPWKARSDPGLDTADVVFFGDQISNSPGGGELLSPGARGNLERPHSLYLIGDRLELAGPFSVRFKPDCLIDEDTLASICDEEWRGFYLAANRFTLDAPRPDTDISGQVDRYGYYPNDINDAPALWVHNADSAVIMSRNVALGAGLAERIIRNWHAFATKAWQTERPDVCPLGIRFYQTITKQIDTRLNGSARALLTAFSSGDCIQEIVRLWPAVIREEMASRPANVLHRFVSVETDEQKARQAYFSSDFGEAPAIFSQLNLETWGLAYAGRLQLALRGARLQGNGDEIGAALRQIDSLQSRLLVSPTSATATEIGAVFNELTLAKTELENGRVVVRGASFSDEPLLSSAWLLGAAASSDTWVIPTSLALNPVTADYGKLGRIWVGNAAEADPEVRLQFLARFMTNSDTEAAAARALKARGLRYAGVASELTFGGVRQAAPGTWRFENPTPLNNNTLLLSIATRQSSLQLLLVQLNTTGLPVEVDWKSVDPLVSSERAGPIRSFIRLGNTPWISLPVDAGAVRNPAAAPIALTALSQGDRRIPIQPPIPIAAGQVAQLPTDMLGSFIGNAAIVGETQFDPGNAVAAIDKLAIAAPDSSVLQVRISNTRDQIDGSRVRAARIKLTIRDAAGKDWMGDVPLLLARFGLPEDHATLSLLLPAAFHILVSGDFLTEAGTSRPIKPQDVTGTEITIE